MLVDLHTHSTESDGWWPADRVVAAAAERGVRVVALSDHDCVAGVSLAWREAHRRGLGFVPAVELTTFPLFGMRHILGHGIDVADRRLGHLAERTQAVWRAQTRACLAVLRDAGFRDRALHALGERTMVMPNVLVRFLIRHGLSEPAQAWALIRRGLEQVPEQAYAPLPGPAEAVEVIHAAGGLAVAAHPGSLTDQNLLDDVLPVVDALEVYTYRHTPEQIEIYADLARRHGLLASVGTDFHAYLDEAYQPPPWEGADNYVRRLGDRVRWPDPEVDRGPSGSGSPSSRQAHGSATSS